MRLRIVLLSILALTLGMNVAQTYYAGQLEERVLKSEKPRNLFKRARDKVFRVYVQSYSGTNGGTASLVQDPSSGKKVILTNKHICELMTDLTINMIEQAGKVYFTKPAKVSKKTDLCVLDTPEDMQGDEAYTLAANRPTKESVVLVFGHPYLEELTANIGRYRHEFTLPPEPSDENYDLSGLLAGRLSFHIRPGNSGSPVLNENEELVGVVFARDAIGGLFIPLSSVKTFLGGT